MSTEILCSFVACVDSDHMASGLSLILVLVICLPGSVRGLVPGNDRSMK